MTINRRLSLSRTMKHSLQRTMKPFLPKTLKFIPVEKEPLPSSHGYFKLSELFQKNLRLFRERSLNFFFWCKADNQQQTTPAENNETIPVENNETIPVESNETIPAETEPLPRSHGCFKPSDLFQKYLRLFLETLIKLLFC